MKHGRGRDLKTDLCVSVLHHLFPISYIWLSLIQIFSQFWRETHEYTPLRRKVTGDYILFEYRECSVGHIVTSTLTCNFNLIICFHHKIFVGVIFIIFHLIKYMSIFIYVSFQKCGSNKCITCLSCDYFCLILMVLGAAG